MELLKAGAISCSIQDMEKADRENYNKVNLTYWVDEFEEQKLDASATKKDIMKMRDEMAVQYQATFKQVVEINEKTEKIAEHNQKMKTILAQINELMEHLDSSLLKRSEVDRLNNNALLRVISDLSEIRVQLESFHQAPRPSHKATRKGDHPLIPLTIPSQTTIAPPPTPPTPPHRVTTNEKSVQLKKKNEDMRRQLPQIPVHRAEATEVPMPDAAEEKDEAEEQVKDQASH